MFTLQMAMARFRMTNMGLAGPRTNCPQNHQHRPQPGGMTPLASTGAQSAPVQAAGQTLAGQSCASSTTRPDAAFHPATTDASSILKGRERRAQWRKDAKLRAASPMQVGPWWLRVLPFALRRPALKRLQSLRLFLERSVRTYMKRSWRFVPGGEESGWDSNPRADRFDCATVGPAVTGFAFQATPKVLSADLVARLKLINQMVRWLRERNQAAMAVNAYGKRPTVTVAHTAARYLIPAGSGANWTQLPGGEYLGSVIVDGCTVEWKCRSAASCAR